MGNNLPVDYTDCNAVDDVLTGVASVYSLALFILPLRHFRQGVQQLQYFFFFLIAYNHLALTYWSNEDNYIPPWFTILLPIVVALVSIALMLVMVWIIYALLLFLIMIMFFRYLPPQFTLPIAFVLALLLYCCLRCFKKSGGMRPIEHVIQTCVMSLTTSVVIVVAAADLVRTQTNDNATDIPRCSGRINTMILCDFQCDSITSDDRLVWNGAWILAAIIAAGFRALLVILFGYSSWSDFSRKCCYCRDDSHISDEGEEETFDVMFPDSDVVVLFGSDPEQQKPRASQKRTDKYVELSTTTSDSHTNEAPDADVAAQRGARPVAHSNYPGLRGVVSRV